MNKGIIASLAALSALSGTLGSLFLAYDYLDDPTSNKDNPLRVLLRLGVPLIAGVLPGVALLILFLTLGINNFPFLDVVAHVIALGALAGVANALFISGQNEAPIARSISEIPDIAQTSRYSHGVHFAIRRTVGRALVGFFLGVVGGVAIALSLRTTVDNALTTAGSTGPISMALFGVWPLVKWTPTRDDVSAARASSTLRVKYWLLTVLPGIAVLSLCVGLVNGFFNSRAPQNLYSCINHATKCDVVSTPSAIAAISGTALIHGGIFLIGGVITSLIWRPIESVLIYAWDHVFARSITFGRVSGSLLTATSLAFSAFAAITFMKDAAPVAISGEALYIVVAVVFAVGACLGFFWPIRTIQASLKSPRPLSRFDASMLTCFALCILLSYIMLTNLSDLSATLLNLPHVLGSQTTLPIQFQRIAFYSKAAILLGIPVALAVGGLTRAVYRWAKRFPHGELGAVGIGMIFLALFSQLIAIILGLLVS